MVRGVAGQRPTGTPRSTIEVRELVGSFEGLLLVPGSYAVRQIRREFQRAEITGLHVRAVSTRFAIWPTDVNARLIVMGRKYQDDPSETAIEFHAIGRNTAPIGVVPAASRRLLGFCRRFDRPSDARPYAVCADDDGGMLLPMASVAIGRFNTDHSAISPQQIGHQGVFSDLHPRLARSVDEQGVENTASRAEHGRNSVDGVRCAANADGADIEGDGPDGWAARLRQPIEKSPFREHRRRSRPKKMGRDRVAGKTGAVYAEHPVAFPGEKHRQRRSGTTQSNNDRIVVSHVTSDSRKPTDRTTDIAHQSGRSASSRPHVGQNTKSLFGLRRREMNGHSTETLIGDMPPIDARWLLLIPSSKPSVATHSSSQNTTAGSVRPNSRASVVFPAPAFPQMK